MFNIKPEKNVPSKTPYGTVDPAELTNPDSDRLTLWWLGNAGFAINWSGKVLLIDPIIELEDDSDPSTSEIGLPLRGPLPLRARQITRAHLVLLTHDDGDHTGPRTTPELIARTDAAFIGTERTARKLREYHLPEGRMRVVRYDEPLTIDGLTITPTVARHQESDGHTQRGDCCGFLLERDGLRLWHPNDTDLLEEHLAVTDIDVLLLPIAPHVLGTKGAIRLSESTGARHIIPCHYGTYHSDRYWCTGDPEAVRAGLTNPESRYHLLAIGEKLALPAS